MNKNNDEQRRANSLMRGRQDYMHSHNQMPPHNQMPGFGQPGVYYTRPVNMQSVARDAQKSAPNNSASNSAANSAASSNSAANSAASNNSASNSAASSNSTNANPADVSAKNNQPDISEKEDRALLAIVERNRQDDAIVEDE